MNISTDSLKSNSPTRHVRARTRLLLWAVSIALALSSLIAAMALIFPVSSVLNAGILAVLSFVNWDAYFIKRYSVGAAICSAFIFLISVTMAVATATHSLVVGLEATPVVMLLQLAATLFLFIVAGVIAADVMRRWARF